NGLVSNRFHRLHIAEPDEDKHYLPSHSLNTTIFSINMAARLGFAMSEILELGYGAVLHDVGMMRVKPEIVNKAQPLTPNEMAEIRMHPSFGLDLIHPIKSLPVTTPIICYQENERLDGSGYPMAKGTAILLTFTRIVTIAASYDAMTRTRPYRAALAPYDAITELLKAVHAGKLDSDCTRALLETLSLFPICSGVELSDGRVGYVLDTQGNNYTRPVIAIEYKNDGQPLDQELILDLQRTENQAIRIVRAIPKYTRRVTGRTMKLPTTKA
ncbi:MAG: hypothetical protein HUU29_09060, partial [Planctomycetaceae bacterium]|nr:hypothetical protein [Planctomycetaceae bacterium]